MAMVLVLAAASCSREERTTISASKQFTENIILGNVLADLSRSVGVNAQHRSALGGSGLVLTSLRSGDIDAYVEYTGTLLKEHYSSLNLKSMEELKPVLEKEGLRVSAPLGFNNGYAIGMKRTRAEELGIRTISDLRDHPELKFAFNQEYLERDDGWPSVVAAYNLPAFSDVRGTEHQLALAAVDSGAVDATELYTTDAEIESFDLVALQDDRHVFTQYDAVILYRADLEERAPEVVAAWKQLTGRIDEAAMIAYNLQASRGKTERQVAAQLVLDLTDPEALLALPEDTDQIERGRTFQSELPAIAAGENTRSTVGYLAWLTWEHLRMVLVSMLAGTLVAIPLGVIAAKDRTVGRLVLPGVGVLQTIPSLALLVFMIPLLGLGFKPAVVALFLYSLLPMVRNTQAGLDAVSTSLQESADALGLSPLRKLWLVELPLALPSILAGVKTSVVLTIGFATLGAFIGAGGYGEPILAGVRRDDTRLLLLGAVPAAVMAIVAQLLLDGIGKLIVPRGLRLSRA